MGTDINGIILYIVFSNFISVTIVFLRLIPSVPCRSSLFMLNSLQCSVAWLYQSDSSSLHPILGTLGSSPGFVCLTVCYFEDNAVLSTWGMHTTPLWGHDMAGVGVCTASVLPDIDRTNPKWLFIDFNYVHFFLLLLSCFPWMGTSLLCALGATCSQLCPYTLHVSLARALGPLQQLPCGFPNGHQYFQNTTPSFLLVVWNTTPIAYVQAQMALFSCWEVTPNSSPSSKKWKLITHTTDSVLGNTETFPGLRFAKRKQWFLPCVRERACSHNKF